MDRNEEQKDRRVIDVTIEADEQLDILEAMAEGNVKMNYQWHKVEYKFYKKLPNDSIVFTYEITGTREKQDAS